MPAATDFNYRSFIRYYNIKSVSITQSKKKTIVDLVTSKKIGGFSEADNLEDWLTKKNLMKTSALSLNSENHKIEIDRKNDSNQTTFTCTIPSCVPEDLCFEQRTFQYEIAEFNAVETVISGLRALNRGKNPSALNATIDITDDKEAIEECLRSLGGIKTNKIAGRVFDQGDRSKRSNNADANKSVQSTPNASELIFSDAACALKTLYEKASGNCIFSNIKGIVKKLHDDLSQKFENAVSQYVDGKLATCLRVSMLEHALVESSCFSPNTGKIMAYGAGFLGGVSLICLGAFDVSDHAGLNEALIAFGIVTIFLECCYLFYKSNQQKAPCIDEQSSKDNAVQLQQK
jgi:hypothetical protein